MGFFRTVRTLCTRTGAFPELLNTPLWRAILHSVLLALLCPFVIATVQTCREKKNCTETLQRLEQESGGFGFCGNLLCFNGSFEERHYIFELFGSDMRLDYVTEENERNRLKPDHWREQSGVLLTKDQAIFWTKTPDHSFLFWNIPADVIQAYLAPGNPPENMTEKLYAIARDTSATAPRSAKDLLAAAVVAKTPETAHATAVFVRQETDGILYGLLSLFWSLTFLQIISECLLLLVFGGLCFALMEFLYLRMMPRKLPFGKVYMLTLYAMFPAMIIASLSILLGQTFLSFQTVFLIAFFIYQLFSFKKLGLFLNPPEKRRQDDFPDDDDF